jgi:septal ring factor EnvC (AmiA/AmiB activator)
MKLRTLPLLNAIGCLALIGLVVVQWQREQATTYDLVALRAELTAANSRTMAESGRRSALERDLAVLKEAIEATQQATETTARDLTEKTTLTTSLQTELATARAQVTAWETALKTREERILALTQVSYHEAVGLDFAGIRFERHYKVGFIS